MNYISINGKITTTSQASIPVGNGAFRYGYGVFETMLVLNGAIRLLDYHLDRLFSGIERLQLHSSILQRDRVETEILRIARKNNAEGLCRVRLQAYADSEGLYAHNASGGYVIECFPLEKSVLQINENGLVTGIAQGLKKSVDTLSNIKSCNALIYAMAAKQAISQKWNDALICNINDNIIESTIANIFWVKDGLIFTPPLAEGCIAGVMRRHIINAIQTVTEKPLSEEILMDADEVFLTNAVKGIRWVGNVGNARFENKKAIEIHALISKGMIL